ncbi:unnamed protein product, partial [Ectocarpus fasciculatus]
ITTSLRNKRTKTGTKNNYNGKLNVFKDWAISNDRNCLHIDGSIRVPIEKQDILDFFGYLCRPGNERAKMTPAEVISLGDDSEPYSISHIKGFRSAIVSYYDTTALDPTTDNELNQALTGYEKLITELKKNGLMKPGEGKRDLKPRGYELLAFKFLTKEPTQRAVAGNWGLSGFLWPYLIFLWNLMTRNDSVDSLMLSHMEFSEDALLVEEQCHKGDQVGENKFQKHVYSNPLNPSVCPILSLAVMIFGFENSVRGDQKLFTGSDSKGRFGRNMRETVLNLSDAEVVSLGCDRGDIGTHSCRKGAGTFCMGQISGPNPITVTLRMGHSLGKIKDAYIFQCEGGDQLCGRMISGLPFDNEAFATLPPHFPTNILERLDNDYWNEVVPGYDKYPGGFKTIFPILLASILYHEDFLKKTLSSAHPVFSARVFTRNIMLNDLKSSILLGVGLCKETGMRATGVPPHLAIASKITELTSEIASLRQQLTEQGRQMQLLREDMLITLPQSVSQSVSDDIRSSFTINGAMPLTKRDITDKFDSFKDDILAHMEQTRLTFTEAMANNINATHNNNSNTLEGNPSDSEWNQFSWDDGKIGHCVPLGWRVPTLLNTKTVYDFWWYGNKLSEDITIRPYRLISKDHDILVKDAMKYHRMHFVMEYIEKIIKDNGLLSSGVRNIGCLPISESDAVFGEAYDILITQLYGENQSGRSRRVSNISLGTIYNLIPK